jgi:hypothetical protein
MLLLAACAIVGVTAAREASAADDRANPLARTGLTLLMIEEPGCTYCLRWRNEVQPGYERSEEGRRAPLVQMMRGDPAVAGFPRIVYSPTFLLLSDGREVGRIVGYSGANLFWWQIGPLMEQVTRRAD